MQFDIAGAATAGNAITWQPAMTIYPTTGYVGIGTSTPGAPLQVVSASGSNGVVIGESNNSTGKQLILGVVTTGNGYGQIQSVYQNHSFTPLFLNPNGGNIGIGTTLASYPLDVVGSIRATSGNVTRGSSQVYVERGTAGADVAGISFAEYGSASTDFFIGHVYADGGVTPNLHISRSSTWVNSQGQTVDVPWLTITTAGNVLIAKTSQVNSAYHLDVAGGIRADSVVVNTSGADFVFDENYQQMSLDSLSQYLEKHKHLPGISSSEEMKKDGVSVGALQTRLLQKVEELTLYVIEQNKRIEKLEKENEELRNR